MTSQELIERLELQPHPEGGFFKETYRAADLVEYNGATRAASTAIYYLLNDGAVSHLHRIDADEVWHAYAGSGLRVHIFDDDGYRFLDIGADLKAGQHPQGVVPAGAWFGAELLTPGDFALVGCTVAPGFEFAHFELADRESFVSRYPEQRAIIERLTSGLTA
jgi:predicted cupin superfamily sugar epimerase